LRSWHWSDSLDMYRNYPFDASAWRSFGSEKCWKIQESSRNPQKNSRFKNHQEDEPIYLAQAL
jgi:hypothetical protein